jgi:hypothetical protein
MDAAGIDHGEVWDESPTTWASVAVVTELDYKAKGLQRDSLEMGAGPSLCKWFIERPSG